MRNESSSEGDLSIVQVCVLGIATGFVMVALSVVIGFLSSFVLETAFGAGHTVAVSAGWFAFLIAAFLLAIFGPGLLLRMLKIGQPL